MQIPKSGLPQPKKPEKKPEAPMIPPTPDKKPELMSDRDYQIEVIGNLNQGVANYETALAKANGKLKSANNQILLAVLGGIVAGIFILFGDFICSPLILLAAGLALVTNLYYRNRWSKYITNTTAELNNLRASIETEKLRL